MVTPPRNPYPPGAPWYGRYRGYYSRQRAGCGCLSTLLAIVLLWMLVSLLLAPLPLWPW